MVHAPKDSEGMRLALSLVLLLVSTAACSKKSYAPFFTLDGQQSVLVARDGDDAYVSLEMETIITGLNAVPENAREKDQAIALVSKLKGEQARVRAEAEARKGPGVPTPAAPVFPTRVENSAEGRYAELPPAPVDAGEALPEKPWSGMELALFTKAFGSCFSSGPPAALQDGKSASTQQLKTDSACVKKFAPDSAAGAEVLFLFLDGKLWGSRMEVKGDAGGPPPPPQPRGEGTVLDAGAGGVLIIPGAPRPDAVTP